MKNSMKNSIAKDGRKSKGKFGGFIKNYFLEILGIIIILILLFALINGRKRSTNYNTKNPSNGKVNTQTIPQRDNSKSIKVNNYNKNTYELNRGDFDLFVNQYESQGIFKIKPTDLLEGNTIVRFSSKVYLILGCNF